MKSMDEIYDMAVRIYKNTKLVYDRRTGERKIKTSLYAPPGDIEGWHIRWAIRRNKELLEMIIEAKKSRSKELRERVIREIVDWIVDELRNYEAGRGVQRNEYEYLFW